MMFSFRLLCLLLVSFTVCFSSAAPNKPVLTTLLFANGTLPANGQVVTLPMTFDVTGYPGPIEITVIAAYTVDVCITPYAALTFNLSQNCPADNFRQFVYNSTSLDNSMMLFLNDFSYSFRGRLNPLPIKENLPWDPITKEISLLQNTQYFVSVSFQSVDSKNSTDLAYFLNITATRAQCPPNTIVTNSQGQPCAPFLPVPPSFPTNLTVSKGHPQLFQIQIGLPGQVIPSFQVFLSATGSSSVELLTLYFSLNQYPTPANAQFSFSTTSLNGFNPGYNQFAIKPDSDFNITLDFPQPGLYNAFITSDLPNPNNRTITFHYEQSNCTISQKEGTFSCGSIEYRVLGNDTVSQKLNGTSYFAAADVYSFNFGLLGSSSDSFYTNLGFNYFPTNGSSEQFFPTNGLTYLSFSALGLPQTYILSVTGQTTDSLTIWQGSSCPHDCNGHGSCNANEATCDCDDDYSGDYCTDKSKKLSTLYIILIIIGGAVVLAVLIGVPVALYLNNRKRARYERV